MGPSASDLTSLVPKQLSSYCQFHSPSVGAPATSSVLQRLEDHHQLGEVRHHPGEGLYVRLLDH